MNLNVNILNTYLVPENLVLNGKIYSLLVFNFHLHPTNFIKKIPNFEFLNLKLTVPQVLNNLIINKFKIISRNMSYKTK